MGEQNGLAHSPQVIGNLIGAQHIFSVEHQSFALLIRDKLADGRVCEHRCNEPLCVLVESEHLSPPRPRICDTRSPVGPPGYFRSGVDAGRQPLKRDFTPLPSTITWSVPSIRALSPTVISTRGPIHGESSSSIP